MNKEKMNHLLKYWFPVFIYAGVIFYLSSLPSLQTPELIKKADPQKLVLHVIEYSGLGFLLWRAIENSGNRTSAQTILLSTILGLFYGFSDEIHQYFVPGRFFSLHDGVADGLGSFIGAWIGKKKN